jgi:hypothetical protein
MEEIHLTLEEMSEEELSEYLRTEAIFQRMRRNRMQQQENQKNNIDNSNNNQEEEKKNNSESENI